MTDPKLVEEKQEINNDGHGASESVSNSEVGSMANNRLDGIIDSATGVGSPHAQSVNALDKDGPLSPQSVLNDGLVNSDSTANSGFELQNQDELVRKRQEEIEKEIKANHPFLTKIFPLSSLDAEFANDQVYKTKLQDLLTRYKSIRKTRPDGNCFFRCFGFAYFESLINDKKEYDRFKKIAQESKDQLVSIGFNSFTIEDFHDTFMSVLNNVPEGGVEQLEQAFNDDGRSEYMVVMWRLLTSCYLRKEEEFYQNFLEGYATVKDFCEHEVEPMYRESDHIHIIALTSFLNVGVRVNYMDRSGADGKVNAHDFPDGLQPRIHLLYRPGHYDILYPIQSEHNSSSATENPVPSNGVAE